ncbi:SGNH/GDSL hydrolase family protein [Bacillus sp. B15-48]|uniref:SGNH/GDSL hydrolase family protein n=1 Tax=Bacillus sp. B15-48 TaxID=1548601 RepID=UPI00193F4707|nr:SGNH/GDSL hydrolase family protein [Bacillus sp. B15-48]MBM4762033.1 GDSL family lipase [Bacillus sp. B15-48]
MLKKLTLLHLCILLLAACSQTLTSNQALAVKQTSIILKEPIPEAFIPRAVSIVAIGDSLTEGVGDNNEEGGYLSYLSRLLESKKSFSEIEVNNFGKKGHRTEQLFERLIEEEIRLAIMEADIVTITIGGNDVMKVVKENIFNLELDLFQKEITAYSERLTKIIETLRTINEDATIVLIGIYNPFSTWFSDIKEINLIVDEWNKVSHEVVDQYTKTLFVEINELFLDNSENMLYDDHFHPNDQAYEQIATRVFEELEKINERSYTVRKEESID